jgi:hypothetical protein
MDGLDARAVGQSPRSHRVVRKEKFHYRARSFRRIERAKHKKGLTRRGEWIRKPFKSKGFLRIILDRPWTRVNNDTNFSGVMEIPLERFFRSVAGCLGRVIRVYFMEILKEPS